MEENKNVYREVATRVLDSLYTEFEYKFDYSDIKTMMKDLDISSAVNTIKRSICAKELNLVAYSEENQDMIPEIESRLNFKKLNSVLENIIESRFFGYSISEIVYKEDFTFDVKSKSRDLFDYDISQKKWYYKSEDGQVYIDEDKFLITINNGYKAYRGESILYELFKEFQIKRELEKKLAAIINRYGDRIIWFIYDPNTDESEVKEQAENLKKASSGYAIGIPAGSEAENGKQFGFITLTDLKVEIHTELLMRYEKKIDKFLLGNTLAQNEGTKGTGTFAQSKTHAEQQDLVITDFATYVEEELRKVLEIDSKFFSYDPKLFYLKLSDKIDIDEEIDREKRRKEVEKVEADTLSAKMDTIAKLSQSGYKLGTEELKEFLGFSTLEEITTKATEFEKKKDKIEQVRELRKKYEESFGNSDIEMLGITSFEDIENININLNSLEAKFILGVLQGYANVKASLSEFEEKINPFNLKFDDAIKYFIDVERVGYDFINDVKSEVYNNFKYIIDNTNLEVQLKLLNNIQNNLAIGGTFKDWLENSKDEIEKMGLGKNGSYFETVYRTNMQTAYSIGQYKAQVEIKKTHPNWLYDGVIDGREQDHTRMYDGKIWRADDPIWNSIYPPNGYNCRCNVIPLTQDDVSSMGETIQNKSKKFESDAKENLGKFAFNPGKNYWESIQKTVKEKKITVDKLKKDVEWSIIELDDIEKIDNNKRKNIAKYLLKNLNIEDVKVSAMKIKPYGTTSSLPNKVTKLVLKSDDMRTKESMLKTVFHEVMHASAKGYSNMLSDNLEEVFAESVGNYMVKQNGFNTNNVAISYMNILPKYFDELRKFSEFENCKSVSDFGEILNKLGRTKIKELGITEQMKLNGIDFRGFVNRYTKEEILSSEVKENFLNVQVKEFPVPKEYWEKKFDVFFSDTENHDMLFLSKILSALYNVKGVR